MIVTTVGKTNNVDGSSILGLTILLTLHIQHNPPSSFRRFHSFDTAFAHWPRLVSKHPETTSACPSAYGSNSLCCDCIIIQLFDSTFPHACSAWVWYRGLTEIKFTFDLWCGCFVFFGRLSLFYRTLRGDFARSVYAIVPWLCSGLSWSCNLRIDSNLAVRLSLRSKCALACSEILQIQLLLPWMIVSAIGRLTLLPFGSLKPCWHASLCMVSKPVIVDIRALSSLDSSLPGFIPAQLFTSGALPSV